MKKTSFITPIDSRNIKDLKIHEYIFICLNEDDKLKIAIPDFEEKFISSEESRIEEVFTAKRIAPFKYVGIKEKSVIPVFEIITDDNSEIIEYTNNSNTIDDINNYFLTSKTRESVVKLLKKRR